MARKMKDSGIEWIGEIPEGWEIKYFVQLFSQVKNKNIGLREKNLLSLSYGKIKQKSIETVGGLLPDNFEGYNIIDRNDIVLRLTDLQNDQHSLRVGLSLSEESSLLPIVQFEFVVRNLPIIYIITFIHSILQKDFMVWVPVSVKD